MHVLNLSLDPKALDSESVVTIRNRAYGNLVERYSIVVPSPADVILNVSGTTTAYGIGGANKLVQLWKIYQLVSKIVQEGKCDVITTQDPYFLGLLGYFFARRYHLGFEIQILGIEKLSPLRKLLARFVLHRGGRIRALSNRLRERLIHEFNVSPELIRVVPIYVDVQKLGLDIRMLSAPDAQRFATLTDQFKDSYGKYFNFLTVSRLVSIKNIQLQIEALAEIANEFPDVRLHIVGSGPEEQNLRKMVSTHGLSRQVIFHGPKYGYELGIFYLNADAFLLTSQYEGWGMVIVEAAIAGLPILMTDVGCAGEFIIDGGSGLIFPPRDLEKLITYMRRIVSEPLLRERLSIGATQALKTLPTFEEVLRSYRSHWEHALAHRL